MRKKKIKLNYLMNKFKLPKSKNSEEVKYQIMT